jgi:transcriptional regulator GlxA family with amidase domain
MAIVLDDLLPGEVRACVEFHRRVKDALDFGLRDPSRIVTLGDVADHVGMEKTAFCRYFKLKVGKPYVGILRAVRVRYAAQLLRTSDYSVGEVTVLAGFENRATFARTFRSHFGVTPSAYRSHVTPAPGGR